MARPKGNNYGKAKVKKESLPVIRGNYTLASRLGALPHQHGAVIGIDTETTGLDARTHRLVGISFSCESACGFYTPVGHGGDATRSNAGLFDIVAQLNDYDRTYSPTWVFYNAKFDLRFLQAAGFSPRNVVDVAILLYIRDLAGAESNAGLKETTARLLGLRMTTIKELFASVGSDLTSHNFSDLEPSQAVVDYACADADATLRLYHKSQEPLGYVYPEKGEIELLDHALISPIMAMEDTGMVVDSIAAGRLHTKIEQDIEGAIAQCRLLTGVPEFNPASSAHVGAALYEPSMSGIPIIRRTRKGNKPSTDGDTLTILQRKYGAQVPLIGEILHYRDLVGVSRFTEKLRGGTSPVTGRVHPQYNQVRQITGRLSTTGDGQWLKKLNFQGIPNRADADPHNIRNLFKATPGWKWVSMDLSNIEIRLIAEFSRDQGLLDMLNKKGSDFHAMTAKALFGKEQSDPEWSKWRQVAKICNFNLAYAFGITTLRDKIETEAGTRMSKAQCQDLFEAFFTRAYPGWGQYKKDLVKEARRTMLSTTLFGRRRRLNMYYPPDPYFGCAGDRQAVSHPIQGSCADLLRKAIIDCGEYVKRNAGAVRMLCTVHDEINFEIKHESDDKMLAHVLELKSILEWAPDHFVVPIKSSVSIGDSWGGCEDVDFD